MGLVQRVLAEHELQPWVDDFAGAVRAASGPAEPGRA
jgi:hypothetical protein